MANRNSLCKIILILNQLIMIVIHNLATLTDFARQLLLLRHATLSSIIIELLNVLSENQMINDLLRQFPRFRHLFTKDHWPKQSMRNVYAEAISTPDNFIRLTGLSPVAFNEIYVLFRSCASRRIAQKKRRHLSLINKNLLFLLIHWLRCYPAYPSLALLFRVSPRRISYLIRRFLPDLAEALVSFLCDQTVYTHSKNDLKNLDVFRRKRYNGQR